MQSLQVERRNLLLDAVSSSLELFARPHPMAKTNHVLWTLLWVDGLATLACGGKSGGPPPPPPPTCVEGRVDGELSGPGSMPPRPLWADDKGLHVVYVDRQQGIVRETLSPGTGQEVASEADQPCPSSCGLRAMARNPRGDMATSFYWRSSDGVSSAATLLLAGDGTKTTWQEPWSGQ